MRDGGTVLYNDVSNWLGASLELALNLIIRSTWCSNIHHRHHENFWVFTGLRRGFGQILLISNMIIHRSFTVPTHLLLANVRGPANFAVTATIFVWFRRHNHRSNASYWFAYSVPHCPCPAMLSAEIAIQYPNTLGRYMHLDEIRYQENLPRK